MLPFTKLSGLALAGLFVLSTTFGDARPVPHSIRLYRRFTFAAKPAPAQWATEQLEDYDAYHFRYLAVSCHTQHDTAFFESCCHPRRKTQSEADFPAQCSLSGPSLSAASEIVAESTGGEGAVEAGSLGKSVYVPAGDVVALHPVVVDGKNTTLPPTKEELAAIAKAKAENAHFGSQSGPAGESAADSATTSTSASASTTPTRPTTPSAYSSTTSTKEATPTPSSTPAIKEPSYTPTPTPSVMHTVTATYDWRSAQSAQAVASAAAAASASEAAAAAAAASASEAAAAAAKASAAAAKSPATSGSSSGGSGSSSSSDGFSGASQVFGKDGESHATFFYQNGVAGACGEVHSDSTPIIALYTSLYANGAHCGKKVLIKNTDNGKEVYATVADECPTCTTPTSIDLSVGAYNQIGAESAGVLPITWAFLD